MRIQKVSSNPIIHNKNLKIEKYNQFYLDRSNEYCLTKTESLSEKYFNNNYQIIKPGISLISFKGYRVYILDGGNHSSDMYNFANVVLKKDSEAILKRVQTIPGNDGMKNLRDLKEKIIELLNSGEDLVNQYVAIPALAGVGLLNLQDRLRAVLGVDTELTPMNIKANKPLILELLKTMCSEPEKYKQELSYMDDCNQEMGEVYDVINWINKLVEAKARVFIPAGHPFDQSLKYLARERNLKPELYYYISTGKDVDGKVAEMKKFIKDNNWYEFNLLTLSDANIITIRDKSWGKDYIFAGYDTCITDSARGVYNLSPVREDGKLVGYSFRNTNIVEYPYESFPANSEVANIAKFVGLQADSVIASEAEIQEFFKTNDLSKLPDKLYPVDRMFSKREIDEGKIRLRGDYVDKTKKLFFRKNSNNEIIFPQCDCEGSGKPSIKSMWGTCFAVFNAIEKDIYYQDMQVALAKTASNSTDNLPYLNKLGDLLYKAHKEEDPLRAEDYYNQAIELVKSTKKNVTNKKEIMPFIELGDSSAKRGLLDQASGCYNMAIRLISKLIKSRNSELEKLRNSEIEEQNIKKLNDYITEYNNSGFFKRLFMKKPYVRNLVDMSEIKLDVLANKLSFTMSELYEEIGNICKQKGENEAAECCYKASIEIKNATNLGDKIISRRADNNDYIGDLLR